MTSMKRKVEDTSSAHSKFLNVSFLSPDPAYIPLVKQKNENSCDSSRSLRLNVSVQSVDSQKGTKSETSKALDKTSSVVPKNDFCLSNHHKLATNVVQNSFRRKSTPPRKTPKTLSQSTETIVQPRPRLSVNVRKRKNIEVAEKLNDSDAVHSRCRIQQISEQAIKEGGIKDPRKTKMIKISIPSRITEDSTNTLKTQLSNSKPEVPLAAALHDKSLKVGYVEELRTYPKQCNGPDGKNQTTSVIDLTGGEHGDSHPEKSDVVKVSQNSVSGFPGALPPSPVCLLDDTSTVSATTREDNEPAIQLGEELQSMTKPQSVPDLLSHINEGSDCNSDIVIKNVRSIQNSSKDKGVCSINVSRALATGAIRWMDKERTVKIKASRSKVTEEVNTAADSLPTYKMPKEKIKHSSVQNTKYKKKWQNKKLRIRLRKKGHTSNFRPILRAATKPVCSDAEVEPSDAISSLAGFEEGGVTACTESGIDIAHVWSESTSDGEILSPEVFVDKRLACSENGLLSEPVSQPIAIEQHRPNTKHFQLAVENIQRATENALELNQSHPVTSEDSLFQSEHIQGKESVLKPSDATQPFVVLSNVHPMLTPAQLQQLKCPYKETAEHMERQSSMKTPETDADVSISNNCSPHSDKPPIVKQITQTEQSESPTKTVKCQVSLTDTLPTCPSMKSQEPGTSMKACHKRNHDDPIITHSQQNTSLMIEPSIPESTQMKQSAYQSPQRNRTSLQAKNMFSEFQCAEGIGECGSATLDSGMLSVSKSPVLELRKISVNNVRRTLPNGMALRKSTDRSEQPQSSLTSLQTRSSDGKKTRTQHKATHEQKQSAKVHQGGGDAIGRKYHRIKLKKSDGYYEIVIAVGSVKRKKKGNRLSPDYNYLDVKALRELISLFLLCKRSRNCKVVMLSSVGPVFCSGLDPLCLFNWTSSLEPSEDVVSVTKRLTEVLIDFEKPIIAIVQGPAVGFGGSLLLFCDVIYASERANIQWPAAHMGISVCGCVSYLLPKLTGPVKARSLLLAGMIMTAKEAAACGIITEVFPHDSYMLHGISMCRHMCSDVLRPSVSHIKNLLLGDDRRSLRRCNVKEVNALKQCLESTSCQECLEIYIVSKLITC